MVTLFLPQPAMNSRGEPPRVRKFRLPLGTYLGYDYEGLCHAHAIRIDADCRMAHGRMAIPQSYCLLFILLCSDSPPSVCAAAPVRTTAHTTRTFSSQSLHNKTYGGLFPQIKRIPEAIGR